MFFFGLHLMKKKQSQCECGVVPFANDGLNLAYDFLQGPTDKTNQNGKREC